MSAPDPGWLPHGHSTLGPPTAAAVFAALEQLRAADRRTPAPPPAQRRQRRRAAYRQRTSVGAGYGVPYPIRIAKTRRDRAYTLLCKYLALVILLLTAVQCVVFWSFTQ